MEGQTGDMDEAGGNAMPRGGRLDAPGTLQHVMVRGIERKRIVSDDKDRKNLADRTGDLARARSARWMSRVCPFRHQALSFFMTRLQKAK
jgi:hypothetical protein